MKSFLCGLAGLALLAQATTALADPSGTYDIDGMNPDGSVYSGTVLVAKVGETFSITYSLSGNTTVMGTAIGDDDILAIGYGEAKSSGVALMVREDNEDWTGVWSYQGSKDLGTETWIAR